MEPTHNRASLPDPTIGVHAVSAVLGRAAMYIVEHGAHVPASPYDDYDLSRDQVHPAASDVGAIALVVYGEPVRALPQDDSPKAKLVRQAINAWLDWLEETYGADATHAPQ